MVLKVIVRSITECIGPCDLYACCAELKQQFNDFGDITLCRQENTFQQQEQTLKATARYLLSTSAWHLSE